MHDQKTYAIPFLPAFEGDPDPKPDDKPALNLEDPSVKAAIDNIIAEREKPLKANRDEILAEKRKLQEQLDELKSQWDGLDAESVKGLMKQIESSEDAKLISQGKVDEVIERRTERLRQQTAKDVEAAQGRVTELEGELSTAQNTIKELVVDASIREAASKIEGFVPGAIFDAVQRGRQVFTVDEDRNPVALDADGSVIRGSDGKTPLHPAEWLKSLVAGDCRHWLGASNGGGAEGGGVPGDKAGKEAVEKMSSRDKLAVGLSAQAEG